jgi:hypothetical protein
VLLVQKFRGYDSESKGFLDSVAHLQKHIIDSAADKTRKQVDSIEKSEKQLIDSTTKIRKRPLDKKSHRQKNKTIITNRFITTALKQMYHRKTANRIQIF